MSQVTYQMYESITANSIAVSANSNSFFTSSPSSSSTIYNTPNTYGIAASFVSTTGSTYSVQTGNTSGSTLIATAVGTAYTPNSVFWSGYSRND